jgi:hypothetical protein
MDVDAFTEQAKGTVSWGGDPSEQVLTFHPFIPIREGEDPFKEKRVALWGTDRQPFDPSITQGDEDDDDWKRVRYDFDTAWSPPLAFVKTVGKMYPTLIISLMYCEMGMQFRGELVVSGDKVVHEIDGVIRDLDYLVWDSAC